MSPKITKIVIIFLIIAIIGVGSFLGVCIVKKNFSSNENENKTPRERVEVMDFTAPTEKEYEKSLDNWKSYTVEIEGTLISLPISFKELCDKFDFTYSEEVSDKMIEDYGYEKVTLKHEGKDALIVGVTNTTGFEKKIIDSTVSVITYRTFFGEPSVETIYPGKLKIGMKITKDEVIEILGEPTSVKESTYGGRLTYEIEYSENKKLYYNFYKVEITDGVIDYLELNRY